MYTVGDKDKKESLQKRDKGAEERKERERGKKLRGVSRHPLTKLC